MKEMDLAPYKFILEKEFPIEKEKDIEQNSNPKIRY